MGCRMYMFAEVEDRRERRVDERAVPQAVGKLHRVRQQALVRERPEHAPARDVPQAE